MTAQTLTEPDKIEAELLRLWNGVSKEKTRACLFNLIVFAEHSERMDYIRDIANKVSEKYPCRVLFISSDPNAAPYLKTAVSVVGTGSVACDYIDIGVGGHEFQRVPFVILPHLIPDLPVSLLWAENPNVDHPLFEPLSKLSGRVIFDSESADSLLAFSKRVLALKAKTGLPVADLNWARTAGWRDLLASVFHDEADLDKITCLKITYNDRTTPSFYHVKVQAFYLLAWLCNQLNWQFEKASQKLDFFFSKQTAHLVPASWENLGPGAILSLHIETSTGRQYDCARIPHQEHHVLIQSACAEACDLPYQFVLGKTIVGQSLVKEIVTKGTSNHYLATLEALSRIDRDRLC
jgi:glucose-6-phosphate dehydrogenase assembly protein OpcA